jgi:hypothetical protein
MKTTNIILGIAALFCAAGSAFASILMPPPYYADVRYQGEENFHCTTVSAVCNNLSTTTCKVTINGTTLATVFDNKVLPDETTCTTIVRSNQAIIVDNDKDDIIEAVLILP